MDKNKLTIIWNKTNGHCHFCGKKLLFSSYWSGSSKRGKWQVDHIYPKARGGQNSVENYLPICRTCNRLRWMWTGRKIQKVFQYGTIALREARKKTDFGSKIRSLYFIQKNQNKKRISKKKK